MHSDEQTSIEPQPSADATTGPRPSLEAVLREERLALGLGPEDPPYALCLSGGGIRSATFSLGVLQGLAKLRWLERFHYLSTVSGGGYIGSWLAAWIARRNLAAVQHDLANAPSTLQPAGSNEAPQVRNLRSYSNFLSPVHGLSADSIALGSIYVRNLALHWAMILPVMFALLMLPRVVYSLLAASGEAIEWVAWANFLAAGLLYTGAIAVATFELPLSKRLRGRGVVRPPLARSLATHWFAVPLSICVLFLLMGGVGFVFRKDQVWIPLMWMSMAAAVSHGLGVLLGAFANAISLTIPAGRRPAVVRAAAAQFALGLLTGAVSGAAVGGVLLLLVRKLDHADRTVFAIPLLLVALWVASVLRAGLSRRWASEETREWWGRSSGILGVIAAGWLTLALISIKLPYWLLSWASTWSSLSTSAAGIASVLLAAGTAAYGFWSKHGATIKEKASSAGQLVGLRLLDLAALASVLLIVAAASMALSFVLVRYPFVERDGVYASHLVRAQNDQQCLITLRLAENAPSRFCGLRHQACQGLSPEVLRTMPEPVQCIGVEETPVVEEINLKHFIAANWLIRHQLALDTGRLPALAIAPLVLAAFAFVASVFFGANAFSMNALYGNRLTRAYLGASNSTRNPHPFIGFDPSDNLPLGALGPRPDARRLFLVINSALNLLQPSGGRLEWQQRKAASFFMTPLASGSDVLGFVPTVNYASDASGLSAGRAVTISGAAASPSMGYHSSFLVSLLMAFFNVRLGWWMPNPEKWVPGSKDDPPVGLGPVLSELVSRVSGRSKFVYLSDGGHFENLGLYEMVRRRCSRILVVDAGCDPDYKYEDLENAMRKIRVDFGIEVEFPDGVLRSEQARQTKRHWFKGRIRYSERFKGAEDGEIIVIKPILTGEESLDLRRYAESTRSDGRVFPQQPTSDQFFDEAQFESYRQLGLLSASELFKQAEWPKIAELPRVPDIANDTLAAAAVPKWAPETAAAGSAGLFASLGGLGQSALIASALTVTAAVSVTGTVALSNPEVRLAADSAPIRVIADQEFRIASPPTLQLAPPAPLTLDLQSSLEDLRPGAGSPALLASLDELEATIVDAIARSQSSGDSTRSPDIGEVAIKLQSAAEALERSAKTMDTSSDRMAKSGGDLQRDLRVVVDELRKAAEALDTDRLVELLRNLHVTLDLIRQRVEEISPRESVRSAS